MFSQCTPAMLHGLLATSLLVGIGEERDPYVLLKPG